VAHLIEFLRSHAVALPTLAKFAMAFGYSPIAPMTIWSLTSPQVAATLAATPVAFDTFNPAHQRLIDGRLLNVVILLMLTTSVLGPVLTERFTPRIFADLKPAQAA
jgi:hypothetical protein